MDEVADDDKSIVAGLARRRIRLFKNGDAFTPGKKLVITPRIYRNFEQLLHSLSEEINLVNGAVRKIYTLEGKPVLSLDEMAEGGLYVAAGGEAFKKVAYKIATGSMASLTGSQALAGEGGEKAPTTRAGKRRKPRVVRKKVVASRENEDEKQLFGPTSKAYRIAVFINGMPGIQALKLVLNYRNCRSLDQHLERRISRLYEASHGTRIKELIDIKDGMNVVATGVEGLKKAQYPVFNPAASQFDLKKEDDTPHVVTFFPNGDAYHHGYTLTIRRRIFPNVRKLIDSINANINLLTGRVSRIYTTDGLRVDTLDELLNPSLIQPDDPAKHSHKRKVTGVPPGLGGAGSQPGSPEPPEEAALAAGGEDEHQQHQQQQQQQRGVPLGGIKSKKAFVLVSGDDSFIHIAYDINRIKYRPGVMDAAPPPLQDEENAEGGEPADHKPRHKKPSHKPVTAGDAMGRPPLKKAQTQQEIEEEILAHQNHNGGNEHFEDEHIKQFNAVH